MAKLSMIERGKKILRVQKKYEKRRKQLKMTIMSKSSTIEERFDAQIKLADLPRNGSKVRYRNRCELTGRPRGYYRKFKMSRIALRDLASFGLVPGVTKSSW